MNDEEFLAGKNELMCREIEGVLSEDRATEIGKRILIVTSNPTGAGAELIRKRFVEEGLGDRVEVMAWNEVQQQEPGNYDVMVLDEVSTFKIHNMNHIVQGIADKVLLKRYQGKGPRGRWGKLK